VSRSNISSIVWDAADDPRGNVQHIAEHNLTMEDVEYVLENPTSTDTSRSSARPIIFGDTRAGRYIMVVYEMIDSTTAYPITAYEVRRPKRKRS
jgi:uncharacterized DUF497 family protein